MEKDGVWGLLNHDTKLLRSLARLSLVSSFDPFLVLAKENEKKGVWPDFSCLQKLADFKIRTGFDFIETTDSGMLFFV